MTVTYGAGWTMSPARLLRTRIDNLWRIGSECINNLNRLKHPETEDQHIEAFMERVKLTGVLSMLESLNAELTIGALMCLTALDWTHSGETDEVTSPESMAEFIVDMEPRTKKLVEELPELTRESWEQFALLIELGGGPDRQAEELAEVLNITYNEVPPSQWQQWAKLIDLATSGPIKLQ